MKINTKNKMKKKNSVFEKKMIVKLFDLSVVYVFYIL